MPDEVHRLGKLLRAFVLGQLAAGVLWAIGTAWVAPATAGYRFGVISITGIIAMATLTLERRGHRKAAAALFLTAMWIVVATRGIATGSISHGSWFLFAVLVGQAGLFIGLRAAIVTILMSAAFGVAVIVLVEHRFLMTTPPPGPWLDWAAGVLIFTLIAILEVSAVRLYRGGLELAEQASRRHRALFDGAPIALFELDLHSLRESFDTKLVTGDELSAEQIDAALALVVTTDVNHPALRLIGAERSEGVRIEPPRDVLVTVIGALLRREQVVEKEIALELIGERRQVVVRAELAHDLHHVIVSLADVTEQRRLAEVVHDERRLETVASLAGSIAHDFNNLLTVSQMNADRLVRRVAAVAASRELERIRDANTRASSLTRQLLVFSRRDIAHRQVFDPARVLAALEPMLRRTLDTRIKLEVELQSEGAAIEMDPSQLELLVTNLAHNAVDAMTEQGTLRIECRRRSVGSPAVDHISIVVGDTGHGMTSDTRERAFEPFFTSRPGKRVGLGLAIVRSIVRDSAGTIDIDSTPETGTRVEVLLPVTTAPITTTDPRVGNERVLLVEDDDGIREVARATLEEAGYTVVAVSNGAEALAEVAAGTRVDLILTDLVMPGLGGRELVDQVRATYPTLPVLYMSGHAADGPPVLDGAHVGFLAKPFTADQLLASVRSVLPIALL